MRKHFKVKIKGKREEWAELFRNIIFLALILAMIGIATHKWIDHSTDLFQEDIVFPSKIRGDVQFREVINILPPCHIYYVNTTRSKRICGNETSGCFNQIKHADGTVDNILVIDKTPDEFLRWRSFHELAHHIWYNVLTEYEREAYIQRVNYSCNPPITNYASTSVSEDFAENFAAYYNAGLNWQKTNWMVGSNVNYFNWLTPRIGLKPLFPTFYETCANNAKQDLFQNTTIQAEFKIRFKINAEVTR
jgi:hypothetical protein